MNMFCTGLGIARSLSEQGVRVIGLTSQRGVYGNYTRCARTVLCPDSRNEPEALLARLLVLGRELGQRSVIFPTRDDDVIFLDRYRRELEPYFALTIPDGPVVRACLDKWETYLWAGKAGVLTPKCWLVTQR
jgi:predicted ATP-grasp superfamily ATP-dependent carboligase